MKRALSILTTAAVLLAGALAPAQAQYANQFTPAKLVREGKTSKPIAGTGTVIVQVQVNADGTHKAIKVLHSSNGGDNAAAMDIAQNSTYRTAFRGKKPVTSFYDFTLKFHGRSVANVEGLGGASSPIAQKIATLISQQKYAEAKAQATAALLATPSDQLRELLGVADAQSNDFTGAAHAFDNVANITKQFRLIAGQSYANAAVKASTNDPAQALAWAQKAAAMTPGTNAQYALGVAQLANKQYAAALATLKAVHANAFADPKTPTNAKVAIDSSLLAAYTASGDTADATATANEVKQLDPTSTLPARVLGNALLQAGVAAEKAKDQASALKDFEQAAAQGDPQVAVTGNTQAAFLMLREKKPDYKAVQGYAQKALAIKPDDPTALYAEGIALTGIWATVSHNDADKKAALASLGKADQLAKAAGNEALSLSIEGFIKQNLGKAAAAGGPGGGR